MYDRADESDVDTSNAQIRQTAHLVRGVQIGQICGGQVVFNITHLKESAGPEPAPTLAAARRETGPNPYRGLSAFQEEDKDRFFGRTRQIEVLREQMRLLQEQGRPRFLPIYGPSGSGKSSLALAGLVPKLAQEPLMGFERARYVRLVPDEAPVNRLAGALAWALTDDRLAVAKQRELADEFCKLNKHGRRDGLLRTVNQFLDAEHSPLILLIDQFEEMFTQCQNADERQAFIENLLVATASASRSLWVIMTLRSDFLGETQAYGQLNRLFSQQGYLVPGLSAAELREAITEPAERAGYRFDLATVQRLVEQTEGRTGALPLLQFALTRIWDGLQEGVQPAVTLEQIGGVGGALANKAQEIYERCSEAERKIARRVFLGLIQLGEGTQDTRRRVSLESLVAHQEDKTQVRGVVARFASQEARLITVSSDGVDGAETVELTHEALLRNWQRLRQWLNESRDLLKQKRKIEFAAEEWSTRSKKLNGYLLQGKQLSDAQAFHKRYREEFPLSRNAEYYLTQSFIHQRKKGFKLLSIGMLIPTGLSIYTGLQVARYFRLRPHFKQVYEYNERSDKPSNRLIIGALEEINDEGYSLEGVSLRAADLSEATLRAANLSEANLSYVDFSHADLGGANLSRADLRSTYLSNIRLTEANLSGADLSHADLREASLKRADLYRANLSGANLTRADLWGVDFRFTNLAETNLSEANFGTIKAIARTSPASPTFSETFVGVPKRLDEPFHTPLPPPPALDMPFEPDLDNTNISEAYFCRTVLPDKISIDPNRDCSVLGINPKTGELIGQSQIANDSYRAYRRNRNIADRTIRSFDHFFGGLSKQKDSLRKKHLSIVISFVGLALLYIMTKPRKHQILLERGMGLAKQGRHGEALSAYDNALIFKPNNHEIINRKGDLLFQASRYKQALPLFESVLKREPNNRVALSMKRKILEKLGRYEEALSTYDCMAKISPDDLKSLYHKSKLLFNLCRYEEALVVLDLALKIEPDNHKALIIRGILLEKMERYEELLANCNIALKARVNDCEMLHLKSRSLFHLKRYEESNDSLDLILKIKPDDHLALYNKSCCYGVEGDIDGALLFLKQAIEIDKDYQELAKADKDFELVREDTRFQALLQI